MDEIYFVRENNDKKIILKWDKPKDNLYEKFIYDLYSLLEKYEFALEEEVEDKKFTACLSYAKSLDGKKDICCADKERPDCPYGGDYSKCKGNKTFIPCKNFCREEYYNPSTGECVEGREVCNGTKERDECSCGGNKLKCSFYKYNIETGRME